MEHKISPVSFRDVPEFFPVFRTVLETGFPIYGKQTVRFFLEKVYQPANFTYWIERGMKTVFVARSGDAVTGFAVIDEPYGGVSLCRWLGVLKEYRSRGIGSSLIRTWLALARLQKCHKAEVASQPDAKPFYEKMGLELEGMRKKSYFGSDQYVFGKVLGEPDEILMTR